MKTRIWAAALAMLLASVLAFPVHAAQAGAGPEPDADAPGVADLTFSISEARTGQGLLVVGALSGIDSLLDLQAQSVLPYYSLDGASYLSPWAENPELAEIMDWIHSGGGNLKRPCLLPRDEPYKSFLDGSIQEFYVRLHIVGGPYAGDTVAARLERPEDAPLPLPEEFIAYPLRYPDSMRVSFGGPYQYCVTMKQGADQEELRALLPESLELESQIDAGTGNPFPVEPVRCAVTWNLAGISTDAPGEIVVENAAVCTPPPSAVASIDQRPYSYTPKFAGMPLNLVVTVADEQSPAVQLAEDRDGLCFSMTKPSGSSAYCAEYSLDGGKTWLAGETVPLDSAAVNQVPKQTTLSAPTGFTDDRSPMKELADGTLEGFYVRIRITGGALDGYTQPASWPGTYQYVSTPDVGDSGGDGNKGDAGSNNGGGDSQSGGQRPGLPENPHPENPTPPETDSDEPPIAPPEPPEQTGPAATLPLESSPDEAPIPQPEPPEQTSQTAAPPLEQESLVRQEEPSAQPDPAGQASPGAAPAPSSETLSAMAETGAAAEPAPPPPASSAEPEGLAGEAAAAPAQSGQQQPERESLPTVSPAATVAVVVVLGGGIAAAAGMGAAGTSAAGAAGTGGLAKLLRALRGLLRR